MKKLEDYGEECQKLAINLHTQAMSANGITDEINAKFDGDLTTEQVKKFLIRSKKKIAIILKEDKSFPQKLVQEYWDTITQLKGMNGEMYNLFLELRKNPDQSNKRVSCPHCNKSFEIFISNYNTLIKTSSTILEEIKHVDKCLGRLKNNSLKIEYNYNSLTQKISVILPRLLSSKINDLQRRGIIKILSKKRFRELYPGTEFSQDEEEKEDFLAPQEESEN